MLAIIFFFSVQSITVLPSWPLPWYTASLSGKKVVLYERKDSWSIWSFIKKIWILKISIVWYSIVIIIPSFFLFCAIYKFCFSNIGNIFFLYSFRKYVLLFAVCIIHIHFKKKIIIFGFFSKLCWWFSGCRVAWRSCHGIEYHGTQNLIVIVIVSKHNYIIWSFRKTMLFNFFSPYMQLHWHRHAYI